MPFPPLPADTAARSRLGINLRLQIHRLQSQQIDPVVHRPVAVSGHQNLVSFFGSTPTWLPIFRRYCHLPEDNFLWFHTFSASDPSAGVSVPPVVKVVRPLHLRHIQSVRILHRKRRLSLMPRHVHGKPSAVPVL